MSNSVIVIPGIFVLWKWLKSQEKASCRKMFNTLLLRINKPGNSLNVQDKGLESHLGAYLSRSMYVLGKTHVTKNEITGNKAQRKILNRNIPSSTSEVPLVVCFGSLELSWTLCPKFYKNIILSQNRFPYLNIHDIHLFKKNMCILHSFSYHCSCNLYIFFFLQQKSRLTGIRPF